MKSNPYIGITDFTSFEQVKKMLNVFRKHRRPDSKRMLHIGVMMSFKTLVGVETVWSKVFPLKETIFEIFGCYDEDAYNCLHYADYRHNTRVADLVSGIECAGPWIDALQLDTAWPDPGIIQSGVHASRKSIEVILQIGRGALEEAGNDPKEVVERLSDYEGVINRVLLDKSMGRGIKMDAESLIPFARAIKDQFPNFGLSIAGGLGPNSLGLIEPLVREFPDLSIDAQGKLRPSGNSVDPINWDMASEYLIKALEILD